MNVRLVFSEDGPFVISEEGTVFPLDFEEAMRLLHGTPAKAGPESPKPVKQERGPHASGAVRAGRFEAAANV